MIRSYKQFSGQNLGRLAALSDGIFAVAMTLLVLNIAVPHAAVSHPEQPLWAGGSWQSEGQLLGTLAPLAPKLLVYFMSFLTLGIFWAGQQTHNCLQFCVRKARDVTRQSQPQILAQLVEAH